MGIPRTKKNKLLSSRALKKVLKIISQKELAEHLDIDKSTVNRWQSLGVSRDKAYQLQKLAASRGVDVSIYDLWPELKELIEDH